MRPLECMDSHYDGSHWGINDWYPEIEEGIKKALELGADVEWTTGWYASKKEILSGKIDKPKGNEVVLSASVSDDFDTDGYSDVLIIVSFDDVDAALEAIRDGLNKAWDEAEQNRKDNAIHEGYKVIQGDSWVETYILDMSGGLHETPTGDYYYEWGWQGDTELPEKVKDVLEAWVTSFSDENECTCNGYTIKRWDD